MIYIVKEIGQEGFGKGKMVIDLWGGDMHHKHIASFLIKGKKEIKKNNE